MVDTAPRILVVDSQDNFRAILAQLIRDDGHDVVEAAGGHDALARLLEKPFQVLFCDAHLEDMDGVEVLARARAIQPSVQAVLVGRCASLETAVIALEAGANDYLVKPFDNPALVRAVTGRSIQKAAHPPDPEGLTERLRSRNERIDRANRILRDLTIRDAVTGLYNYRHFLECLEMEVHRSRRSGQPFSVIGIRLHAYPAASGPAGQPWDGPLLRLVAEAIVGRLRKSDVIARKPEGGFALLLPDTPGEGASHLAGALRTLVAEHRFSLDGSGELCPIAATTVVGAFPNDGADAAALLRHVEEGLERASPALTAGGRWLPLP